MKHLLNNLSEEEKNSIREQHEGGMNVDTKRFKSLMESKLGNVKPLINEQNKTGVNPQERMFTFLKGIIDMSSGGGWGWKPSTGNGAKLTSNMLGKYLNQYKDLYGFKVDIGKSLSWDLYPLNPNLVGKAKDVKCEIIMRANDLYIELQGGDNMSASSAAIKGGGYLTTPGSVEKSLEAMKKIYDVYRETMNPNNSRR